MLLAYFITDIAFKAGDLSQSKANFSERLTDLDRFLTKKQIKIPYLNNITTESDLVFGSILVIEIGSLIFAFNGEKSISIFLLTVIVTINALIMDNPYTKVHSEM